MRCRDVGCELERIFAYLTVSTTRLSHGIELYAYRA